MRERTFVEVSSRNLCFLYPKESHAIKNGSASSQSLFPEAEPVKTRTNFANVKGLSSL